MGITGERDPWLFAALDDADGLATLVADGVDISSMRRDKTNPASGLGEAPIHTASGLGNVSAVRFLLDNGADANARDARGAGALHHAAKSGSPETTSNC